MYDYLIVGAGFFGATCARLLTDLGKSCLVIDKRPTLGGNAYTVDYNGIEIHKYGAHIFHTSNEEVWNFISKYGKFKNYNYKSYASYNNELYHLPFNMLTFQNLWGVDSVEEAELILAEQRQNMPINNLESYALNKFGTDIYNKLIKGYTEKQWHKNCKDLPGSIIERLSINFDFIDNYFTDKYQGIPEKSYTVLFENLLEGIDVKLNTQFNNKLKQLAKNIIYSGPIDEYYNYKYGILEWRTLGFEYKIINQEYFQKYPLITYTEKETPYTRIIEHKHFKPTKTDFTVITYEYPEDWKLGKECLYPIETKENLDLYNKYLAEKEPNVYFGGRLGQYKYMNMDQTILSAMNLVKTIYND